MRRLLHCLDLLLPVLALTACDNLLGTDPGPTPEPAPDGAIASSSHSCVLDTDGAAWCWGPNRWGQLGNGATSELGANTPQPVAGGLKFTKIRTGSGQTCGLTSEGAVYCWGSNQWGNLGDGTNKDSPVPIPVTGERTFTDLAVGGGYSACALTADGAVYCWAMQTDLQEYYSFSNAPEPVGVPDVVTQVVVGYLHACALTEGGKLYCWGDNSEGQLGEAAVERTVSPVDMGNPHALVALAAGFYHTCGLTSEGEAWCWGDNRYGALGDGDVDTARKPTPVRAAPARTFESLSLGFGHTCGVQSDGTALCWGNGREGQLGNGSFLPSATPVTFRAGEAVVSIATGLAQTCAIVASGGVVCAGRNSDGELGAGHAYMSTTPVRIAPDPGFVTLSAGYSGTCGTTAAGAVYCWGDIRRPDRSVSPLPGGTALVGATIEIYDHACGLTSDGRAYCWGSNSAGQLGNGTDQAADAPEAVLGDLTFTLISTGTNHTCGTSNMGVAYCWGWNYYGQLGDGTRTDRWTPTNVAGQSFAQVSAGGGHTCGLDAEGRAYCWGNGCNGELGLGASLPPGACSAVPMALVDGHTFSQIVAWTWGTCALTPAGEAYCWGTNTSGQVGSGSGWDKHDVPAAVAGGHTFERLYGSDSTNCGSTVQGQVYCWGENHWGIIGDGTDDDRATPTIVQGGTTFTDFAVGALHACGITESGATMCWGYYGWNLLGNGEVVSFNTPQLVAGGLVARH